MLLSGDENIAKINLKSAKKILKSESLITIPNEKNKDSPGFDEIIENDFEDDEPATKVVPLSFEK